MPLVTDDAEAGEIVTEVTAEPAGLETDVMVTGTVADLVGSATLVAVTTPVPAVDGAVKSPEGVIVPIEAAHVTDSLLPEPLTLAVNCTVASVDAEADGGDTTTEVTGPFPPFP